MRGARHPPGPRLHPGPPNPRRPRRSLEDPAPLLARLGSGQHEPLVLEQPMTGSSSRSAPKPACGGRSGNPWPHHPKVEDWCTAPLLVQPGSRTRERSPRRPRALGAGLVMPRTWGNRQIESNARLCRLEGPLPGHHLPPEPQLSYHGEVTRGGSEEGHDLMTKSASLVFG